MAAPASAPPASKKKHVRFAQLEEDDGDDDNDEQEEDTLFDKRKDASRAPRSAVKLVAPGGGGGDVGQCGRWMITLTLCASFLGLGMCISVLGPTLEDLATNVNMNISNISYIFVGRSGGYIGGSVVGGILFDCMNPHLLLGFSMLITAFGMFAIPFCKKALLLAALMSCIGMSMGFLDTGGNVLILYTWGDQSGPHMQALHFSFAAGAFVSPIIAKMIFGKPHAKGGNGTDGLEVGAAKAANSFLPFARGKDEALTSMWSYVVIGLFVLAVSLLFFILYSCGTPTRDRSRQQQGGAAAAKHHAALIGLLSVFFFWYVGAEVAYGSFIFTYAKDYVHMGQAHAAGLNSVFWGTFAACRGLAIFFAACIYPGTMILLSLAGCTLAALLLTLFSREAAALWSCTALYGAAMATTFPSGISWVEQYTSVTGRSAAMFVVGAALGEMVLPALTGFLLGRPSLRDLPLLMLLCLVTATVTSVLFPVMYKLAAAPAAPEPDDEYRRALLDSDERAEEEAERWNDADFEVIEMDEAGPGVAAATATPSAADPLAHDREKND
ncbi:sodium-dependent glucose transporter 1 [Denticeps clupeoides]|uniref:MFS transporter n=1 Tax=Denticeps clupeoides TaxID=299321 RepID=A0AAY4C9E8_9TELE|nr:sodium-dependent glucose transporter 1 [Denticeps clupeoides]